MTALRAALLAALLAASPLAQAQSSDPSDVSPPLRGAVGAYRAGDLAGAEATLRPLAPGDPDAAAWLGALLLDRGDNLQALRLLQRAADAGSSEGMHRLALVYAEGLAGTPRDERRAAELFERAAAAGHRRAQINIGILYLRGQGVPRDVVQARAWLEKAAAGGDVYALYTLGRAMEESGGLAASDPVRATDLYRRATEGGHPYAVLRYALALNDGIGVKRDPAEAQRLLVQAHEGGLPEAALAMGDVTARRPLSRDKAANAKMLQTAFAWYQAAANRGVASAQYKVATAYLAGVGVERDPMQAQLWYGRAAQQGLAEAQFTLGIMLIDGVAGVVDPIEGYKWLLLAERGGYTDARAVRGKVDEKVSAQDRRQAEARAQGFVALHERPVDIVPRSGTLKP